MKSSHPNVSLNAMEKIKEEIHKLKTVVNSSNLDKSNWQDIVKNIQSQANQSLNLLENEVQSTINYHIKEVIDNKYTVMKNPFRNPSAEGKDKISHIRQKQQLTPMKHLKYDELNEIKVRPAFEGDGQKKILRYNEKKKKNLFLSSIIEEHFQKKIHPASMMNSVQPSGSYFKSNNSKFDGSNHDRSNSSNIFKIKKDKIAAKAIPKEIRKNPFADLPVLTKKDLDEGIYNLVNQGYIPKDVDILPALHRDKPLFISKSMTPNEIIYNDSILELNIDRSQLTEINAQNSSFQKIQEKPSQIVKGPQKVQKVDYFITAPMEDSVKSVILNKAAKYAQADTTIQRERLKAEDVAKNMNHIFLSVSNGTIVKDKIFEAFKTRNSMDWGEKSEVLNQIMVIMGKHNVNNFRIVAKEAEKMSGLMRNLTHDEMLNWVENHKSIFEFVKMRGTPKSNIKLEKYAIFIQKCVKQWISRSYMQRLCKLQNRLIYIQRNMRLNYNHIQTLKKIQNVNDERTKKFIEINKQFVSGWNQIKWQQRVEIHLNSLGYDQFMKVSTKDYNSRQNSQLSRIFRLKDPNLEIIMISPRELPIDILSYYIKILDLWGVADVEERLHFITPYYADLFYKNNLSLSTLLRLSKPSCEKIKRIIAGKTSYIVGGYPSFSDVILSTILEIPYLTGNPVVNGRFWNNFYTKRFLHVNEFPYMVFSSKIKEDTNVAESLATMMIENPQYTNWKFLIDREINGRGDAVFSTETKIYMTNIVNEIETEKKNEYISAFIDYLKRTLHTSLSLANPKIFPNSALYLNVMTKKGGYIEAVPKGKHKKIGAVTYISPSGESSLITTYEMILSDSGTVYGYITPQEDIPDKAIIALTKKVNQKLADAGVFGYVTIIITVQVIQTKNFKICIDKILTYYDEFLASFELIKMLVDPSEHSI